MSSLSLVGGIALRAYDLPGGIVFAAAYGLLVSAVVYRIVDRRSRTTVHIQLIFFAVERVVFFSLRSWVAAAHPVSAGPGLTQYQQATLALGFLSLAHLVATVTRAVLVNTTKGVGESPTTAFEPTPLVSSPSLGLWKATPAPSSTAAAEDDPQRRFWFRRWSECMLVLYLAGVATASVATARLYAATDSSDNRVDQILRYTSAAIGLVLVLSTTTILLWAQRNAPWINQRAVRFLLTLTTILMIPPMYRLVVMRSTTPNIADADHRSLNTVGDKAAFYVLHILPEWTVVALMCIFDVRDVCQFGYKGDERWRDETPNERTKRERKEREREMKRVDAKNAAFEMKSSSNATDSASTLA